MEEVSALEQIGNFVKDYDILLVSILTIIGWLVVYWLNLRAQRRSLYIQSKNDARLSITIAIREYQDWLFNFKDIIWGVKSLRYKSDEDKKLQTYLKKIYDLLEMQTKIYRWVFHIEEYRGLFQISRRDLEFLVTSYSKAISTISTLKDHLEESLFKSKEINDELLDEKLLFFQKQIRLMNDLIKGYQDAFFDEFKEYNMPPKEYTLFHKNRVNVRCGGIEVKKDVE